MYKINQYLKEKADRYGDNTKINELVKEISANAEELFCEYITQGKRYNEAEQLVLDSLSDIDTTFADYGMAQGFEKPCLEESTCKEFEEKCSLSGIVSNLSQKTNERIKRGKLNFYTALMLLSNTFLVCIDCTGALLSRLFGAIKSSFIKDRKNFIAATLLIVGALLLSCACIEILKDMMQYYEVDWHRPRTQNWAATLFSTLFFSPLAIITGIYLYQNNNKKVIKRCALLLSLIIIGETIAVYCIAYLSRILESGFLIHISLPVAVAAVVANTVNAGWAHKGSKAEILQKNFGLKKALAVVIAGTILFFSLLAPLFYFSYNLNDILEELIRSGGIRIRHFSLSEILRYFFICYQFLFLSLYVILRGVVYLIKRRKIRTAAH